nr:MAG TPA: hypothetical protein [Caudoviricetes sp.]
MVTLLGLSIFGTRMLLKNVIKGIRRPIPDRPFCLETKWYEL